MDDRRPAVTLPGAALVAAAYLALAVGYAAAIAWPRLADGGAAFAAAFAGTLPQSLVDYGIKGVLTLGAWLVVSRLRRPGAQLAAHAVLGPLWVAAWFWTYRALAPAVGYYVLDGGGQAWDVFIPALVYISTFGALHAARHLADVQARAAAEARLAARNAELERTARDAQLAALRAQMDPHFLFNTLNSVAASVPAELGATRDLVARLAGLVRYTLGAAQRTRVPLRDEVAFVRDYLALEAERMGERLTVEIDAGGDVLDTLVPPMLLQPLVENAVRHGLAPTVSGGTVWVRARRRGDAVEVTVRDDGAGPDRPPPDLLAAGVGLGTTDARLRALGTDGLRLATPGGDGQARGFEVAFTLPADARAADGAHSADGAAS